MNLPHPSAVEKKNTNRTLTEDTKWQGEWDPSSDV